MRRTIRSSTRFERALGLLFEKLEGREAELQQRIDEVIAGLLTGDLKTARLHNPNDATACIPLIDDFVVVIQPVDKVSIVESHLWDPLSVNLANTEHIDLLTVEREPR